MSSSSGRGDGTTVASEEGLIMKLKPCPFCGGERAEVLNALEEQPEMELVGLTKDNWNVVCGECFAMGGTRRTATEAMDAWNRRVGDDLAERMEDDGR
jgi:Lar family restriction alleviation protein